MKPNYPPSFQEVAAWAEASGVTLAEARVRFAQYAVLRTIAEVPALRQALVFKGGNALDFVWQPNRSTVDLDFSLDPQSPLRGLRRDDLSHLLAGGVPLARTQLGVVLAVHRIRQNPPGTDKDFVTYEARIGYALPDQDRLGSAWLKENRARTSSESMSASTNRSAMLGEPICDARLVSLEPALQLRVATLEDIVAEKLRALLQQPIRNRERRQDVLDIAVILQANPTLDRNKVAGFLQEKAAARAVPVSRSAFHDPEVARRAQADYEALSATTRTMFVPFAAALALLHDFIAELAIPE